MRSPEQFDRSGVLRHDLRDASPISSLALTDSRLGDLQRERRQGDRLTEPFELRRIDEALDGGAE